MTFKSKKTGIKYGKTGKKTKNIQFYVDKSCKMCYTIIVFSEKIKNIHII